MAHSVQCCKELTGPGSTTAGRPTFLCMMQPLKVRRAARLPIHSHPDCNSPCLQLTWSLASVPLTLLLVSPLPVEANSCPATFDQNVHCNECLNKVLRTLVA